MLNFLKNLAKVKSENFEEGFVNLAASLDADAVAETAVKQKQDEHDEVIRQLAEANASYKKEKKEFDDEQYLFNKRMSGAERAQADLDALTVAKSALALDASNQSAAKVVAEINEKETTDALTQLLTAIEERAPILEKERLEMVQAEEWMNSMQEASSEIAKELISLRDSISQIKRETTQAELEMNKNRKKAEQAEILVGLRKSGNKFDVAMNALKNRAAATNQESEEFRLKAEQLTVKPILTSESVNKYLNDAPATSTESLQERLARLKQK